MRQKSPGVNTQMSQTFGYAEFMGKIVKSAVKAGGLTEPVGRNLGFLLRPVGKFENVRQLAIAMNGKIEDESYIKKIRRAMYASEVAITMTTLQEIADGLKKIGYEVEPWQLLVPNSNPANPRILMPVDPAQRKLWEAVEAIRQSAVEENVK